MNIPLLGGSFEYPQDTNKHSSGLIRKYSHLNILSQMFMFTGHMGWIEKSSAQIAALHHKACQINDQLMD